MTKLRLFLFSIVSLACIAAPALQGTAKADTFNQNNIISDAVFENDSSMTAAQIDNFLNGFPNSCISTNSGFAAEDPTGYDPTNGFSYGGYVSAGQVIYDASQAYGINPQVLLATLQKEQSLVVGGSGYCEDGNMNKYAAAVGYGCPDGGTSYSYSGISLYRRNGTVVSSVSSTCVNSAAKAGFSEQIIRAAWLFRFGEERSEGNINWAIIKGNWNNSDDPTSCYSGPMTQGTFQRCPSGSTVYYDGYTTIDGTAVHMDNGSTAALYWYTPHFSGNQNFFNIFTSWFGSTQISFLVRTPSSPTYYLLTDNTRYAIPNGDILYAYGIQSAPLSVVSDSYLSSIPDGGTLSTIFTIPGNGTVFLADGGKYYGISSGTYCTNWGLACGNSSYQKEIGTEIYNLMGNGGVLQSVMHFQNAYYLMQNGNKQQFLSPTALTEHGYNASSTTPIVNWTNAMRPFDISFPQNNSFVKFGNSNAIYLYSGNTFFSIPDFETYANWLGPNGASFLDTTSSYNSTPPSTVASLSTLVTDSGTVSLVGYNQVLNLSGASPSTPPLDLGTYTQLKPLLSGKQTITIDSTKALALPSGTITALINNELRPIPTLEDLHLSYSDSNVVQTPSAITQAYPVGKLFITPGRIVREPNSSALYVYGADKNLWAFGNMAELDPVSTWVPGVVTAPFSDVDQNGIQTYASMVSINGSYYGVQADGSIRSVPTAVMSANRDAYSVPLSGPVAAKPPVDTRSLGFIRFDNGTIFQIGSTSINPISSLATYQRLGGNTTNTLQLPLKALNAFTTGQPIQ